MSANATHQGFVSLLDRLFAVGGKGPPSNVYHLPVRRPDFTEREVAEMSLKELEEVTAVLKDIGLYTMAGINEAFVRRMREQLKRAQ